MVEIANTYGFVDVVSLEENTEGSEERQSSGSSSATAKGRQSHG